MLRRALLAATCLLLAACGQDADERAPFAQSRIPPSLAGRFFPPEGWAWGLVQTGGAPAQRYGVAAPRGLVPKAHILVIVGAGESAEAWFETARDLNARGAVVWVLDRAGQGGSGRYADPREMIHAPSFDPDVASVKTMLQLVVRADPATPVFLVGQADGAVVALRALQSGARVQGVLLSAPRFGPDRPEHSTETLLRRLGRGAVEASGSAGWSRRRPDVSAQTHDAWRGAVEHAWQTANPDLRMAGQSIAWRQGWREAAALARRNAQAARAPVLMLVGAAPALAARSLCDSLPDCSVREIEHARASPHLESDAYRKPWLDAVGRFAGIP